MPEIKKAEQGTAMIPFKKVVKGFLAGAFLGAAVGCTPHQAADNSLEAQAPLMLGVMDLVRQVHVDGDNAMNGRKATVDALRGMLQGLDPHSRYLTAEEFQAEEAGNASEFGGIGVEIATEGKFLRIDGTIEGGPSVGAGVKAGDLITHVNGKSLEDMEPGEAIRTLRGRPGDDVKITVTRDGAVKPLEIMITRAIIEAKQVRYDVIGNDIGYISLSHFGNDKAADEVRDAVKAIEARLGNNVKGYVLDLRDNPGGLLIEAVRISDHFLDAGKVVVSSRGRTKENNYDMATGVRGDITGNKPLIVLINGGSASASELVSAALQDHKRATILGTQSFGKGSVQSTYQLKNGDAVAITTALYYTPGGRSVQNVGVTPDILFVPKTPEARAYQREADMLNSLKPKAGSNSEVREQAQCTARVENTPVQGLPKVLVLHNKKADEMLLCAIDNLRGGAQYTVTQPAPKGP